MNREPEPKEPSGVPFRETPLSERDFIRNGWSLKSFPFWLWIFMMAAFAGIIWGAANWYQGLILQEKKHNPFLEVTNRDFSVFLWQFPSYLRANVSKKTGYLPGFLTTSENLDIGHAEDPVTAPPNLVFLYHTWHRLLAADFIPRPIPASEFQEFLKQLPEWEPKNWKNAPSGYVEWVSSKKGTENLQKLSESELPLIVRQAFQGWKNYYQEGPKINEMHPTYAQVIAFLEKHPTYGRSYWRNIDFIEGQHVAGPDYLLGLLNGKYKPEDAVPDDQLAPFLKVALFNAEQAKNNQ